MSAIAVPRLDPLEVRIHRGAHEIGGNCVELRHGRATLILDIGKPLTAARDTLVPLPQRSGSTATGPALWASSSAMGTRTTGAWHLSYPRTYRYSSVKAPRASCGRRSSGAAAATWVRPGTCTTRCR
jgi:hypothetical protein